jgi:RNA polymerase sigma-70 factor (ECF subfamily)
VTDSQLLERFAACGDTDAFSTLARRHTPRVRGVCRRILLDDHDAEDALQATFLVLARKRVFLPPGMSVGPWLSSVALRLALHARAARRRRREYPAGLLVGDMETTLEPVGRDAEPFAELARKELRDIVREELASLPDVCRVPAWLCYLEGKTNEQAARELGWPIGSMSRRLDKARRLVRQRLLARGVVALTGILFVLCLVLLGRWLGEGGTAAVRGPGICAVGHNERPNTDRVDDEALLYQLAEGTAGEKHRASIAGLATRISRAAEQMETRAPAAGRDQWERLAREMGSAAQQLALAGEDRPTTQRAAMRVRATCLHCHEVFRD